MSHFPPLIAPFRSAAPVTGFTTTGLRTAAGWVLGIAWSVRGLTLFVTLVPSEFMVIRASARDRTNPLSANRCARPLCRRMDPGAKRRNQGVFFRFRCRLHGVVVDNLDLFGEIVKPI